MHIALQIFIVICGLLGWSLIGIAMIGTIGSITFAVLSSRIR